MLHLKVNNFRAGNINNFEVEWREITSDKFIIDIIRYGLRLNFSQQPPEKAPFEYKRPEKEFRIIDLEIIKLQSKGVISHSPIETGDYFSNLFLTPKKDGSFRTILNLKYLNLVCETHHFKMETLKQAIHMIKKNSFLASIDIKDAFYSVPIHDSHKKYLKFMWDGSAYQFNVMPNGYLQYWSKYNGILRRIR